MDEKTLDKIMAEVTKKLSALDSPAPAEVKTFKEDTPMATSKRGVTEFVGIAKGDTIGLVIANIDPSVLEHMNVEKKYKSLGILGARTGAGPQILAADEAVKATNTEIVSIELPRDTKGGAGHGSLIIFGGDDVSDCRRAIEVALREVNEKTFGDVYANEAGHIELQYTARASFAINKVWGAPIGKAFGLLVGAPAAIGVVMADTAVKAANIEVLGYASPQHGNSLTNEVVLTFSGDSGAVRQAVLAAKDIGKSLLECMGDEAVSSSPSYI